MKTFDSTFSPFQLFARGRQGAWLEPRQGYMWQENTGATPTTSGGQTIGLLLDQSQGVVLGPELVTNGTFDTDISGWVQASGPTHVWESGRAKGSSSAAYAIFRQTLTVTAGRTYRVSFDVERGTTAQVIAYLGNSVNDSSIHSTTITASGNNNYVVRVTPTTSTLVVHFRVAPDSEAGALKTYYVDNVSVRQILGNHASQSTAANRPLFGARRNLLTYSEDFSQSVWVKVNCTLIASNATAPDGSNTAATFRFLDNPYSEFYQTAGYDQLAGVLRLGFYTIWIRRRAGSGQVRLKIPQGTAYTDVAVTAEWQKFTSATTYPFTNHIAYFPGVNLNELNGELDIWHPYMTYADAPDDFGGYQRITTATDYDPGPYPALAHDSTDSLSVALPAINVRRNLLTYSEQFNNAAWQKFGLGVIQNAVFCPITTRPSALIYPTLSSDACYIIQNRTTIESLHTFTVVAKRQNKNILWLYHYASSPYGVYYVDLRDGSTLITPGYAKAGILSATHLQDGWYQISLSITAFDGSANWGIGVCDAAGNIASVTATDTDGVFLASAQLELGSVATDYQKITDWTSEQYTSSGSVYFGTPQGMSALHNQSIGTTYTLPALNSDIYGWCVLPSRLTPPEEQQLENYFLAKAGISGSPDWLLDDTGIQVTDDAGELLLTG